jgi:hypothetical protein
VYAEGDIRRYGALTTLADNSVAIIKALTVSANGGNAAYIPGAGPTSSWGITNPIVVPAGSSMYGEGKSSLITVANSIDGLQFSNADSGLVPKSRFFRDFQIQGTQIGSANNANGINITVNTVNVQFQNLSILNFQYGVSVQNLYDSNFFNCFIQNCYHGIYFNNQSITVSILTCYIQYVTSGTLITASGYSTGVSVQGSPEVEDLRIIGCEIYGFNYNIDLGLIFECQIEACDLSYATICPVYFSSVIGPLIIRDCWIELASSASGVWNGGASNQIPGNLTGVFITAIVPSAYNKVVIEGNYINADPTLTGSTGIYLGNNNAGLCVKSNQIKNFDVGIGGGNTLVNTGGALQGALIQGNTINANTSAVLLNSLSSDCTLGPNYIVGGTPLTLTGGWPATVLYTQPDAPMSGTVTFSAATSVAVTFTNPIPTATYQVSLSPSGTTQSPGWASKTVNGFTIEFASAFTGSVDWSISI